MLHARQLQHISISDKFNSGKFDYGKQFSGLYWLRLESLRPALCSKLPADVQYVDKLFEIQPETRCVIIGTLYMEMKLKPNVLEDIENDKSIFNPAVPDKYRSEDDTYHLEDHSGRIQLAGDVLKNSFLVTGMIIAVVGKEVPGGSFEVEEVILPGVAEAQNPAPDLMEDSYVLFASGLNLGKHDEVSTETLLDFIEGNIGDVELSSKIAGVVLAGDSFGSSDLTVDLAKVSAFFERISCNVNVYVLPGANDPVNRAYPQRPIHSALLCRNPKQTGSLHSLSNPVLFKVDDFILLGSSGENVHDSLRYASNDVSAIDALERMVHCQHIAPSAPDTLFCFPYQTKDPFLLQKLPHVLFAGNQDACQYRVLEDKNGSKCCLVTIPSFNKTKSVVILNLKDFSCFELAF